MAESPATSSYPASLDSWQTLTDKEDLSEASDLNKIKDAILEVQTELGTDPAGSMTDVKTRLAVNMADNGTVKTATTHPVSPVANQIWVNTTEDKLYRRNNAGTQNLEIGTGGHTLLGSYSLSATTNSGDITIAANQLYLVVCYFTIANTDTIMIRVNSSSTGTAYSWHRTKNNFATAPTETHAGDDSDDAIDIFTLTSNGYLSATFTIDTFAKDNEEAFFYGQGIGYDGGGVRVEFAGAWNAGAPTSFEIASSTNMTGTIYLFEYNLS